MPKYIVTVLIADGKPDSQGDVIKRESVFANEFIPVTRNFTQEQLGSARLFWDGNHLKAEISMKRPLGGDEKKALTPAIGGRVYDRNGTEIHQCVVEQVALTLNGNCDRRVKTIKEQE